MSAPMLDKGVEVVGFARSNENTVAVVEHQHNWCATGLGGAGGDKRPAKHMTHEGPKNNVPPADMASDAM